MKFLLSVVLVSLSLNLTLSIKDIYKASVVTKQVDINSYAAVIAEAGKSNVDILVLPALQNTAANNVGAADYYKEAVNIISRSAKQGSLYVVAHLLEQAHCQDTKELVRSNLVFDRNGDIVSEYRKPVDLQANCTTTPEEVTTFATDFGVTFGLLMEEDLVLRSVDSLRGLKNFIVAGAWSSEIPFLSAFQFSTPWAYVTQANLISAAGVFAGQAGSSGSSSEILVVELSTGGGLEDPTSPVITTRPQTFPAEDLSQYIIRPLDLVSSGKGYTNTVCHDDFCCEFYIKTGLTGSQKLETFYGLGVFKGARHFGGGHAIGTQTCAIIACAGLYKRSCNIGSESNGTYTHFEKISISATFAKVNSAQFPVIITTEITAVNFKLDRTTMPDKEKVTVEVSDAENLLSFGIFGRDFGNDFEVDYSFAKENVTDSQTLDMYDYLFNEDVQEFFDYVWIRLRIMIFVVSIYVLEML